VLVVARPEARKLEHQHFHFLADVFTRFEKRCREQVRVQKILIRLAGLPAEFNYSAVGNAGEIASNESAVFLYSFHVRVPT
jgi:hypothetical protein